MRDLALIENDNNLEVSAFDLRVVSGSLYVANKLRIRLKTFRGEWFLNTNVGLPYFEEIFKKNPNLDLISDLYIQEILGTTGVSQIVPGTFILDLLPSRRLEIAFTAELDSGELVEITEVV